MRHLSALACVYFSAVLARAMSVLDGSGDGNPFNIDALRPLLSEGAKVHTDPEDVGRAAARWSSYRAPSAQVVVVAGTVDDVVATIQHAASHPPAGGFLVHSGGHGWSVALSETVRSGLVLSLSGLNHINVSADNETITAGAGAITDDVIRAADAVQRQLPTTSCFCPSHLGATLGGGVGRFQGLYGLLLDNIVSARVVLSTGEVVTASADSHADLFWGLRGAGAGLGAVVEATYKLHPRRTDDGKIYNLDLLYGREQIREVFALANTMELDAASSVALVYAWIPQQNAVGFLVNFVHVGSAEDGRRAALPYLSLQPTVLEEERYAYDEFAHNVAQKAVVEMCKPARHNMFHAGVQAYDPDAQLVLFDEMRDVFAAEPDVRASYVLFETYSLQAVQAVPSASTAYAQRDIRHHVLVVGGNQLADSDKIVENWGGRVRRIAAEHGGWPAGDAGHLHLNFARGDESVAAKYGEEWRLTRLRGLKARFDPAGLFGASHPFTDGDYDEAGKSEVRDEL